VPLDALDQYGSAWSRLAAAVTDAGGRAWLFRGAAHQDQFLEFIEWSGPEADGEEGGLPESASIASLRDRLDRRFGHAHLDEWEEARLEML
jgi:hypothetical protein